MTAVRVAVEVSADGTVRARLFGRHAYSARDTVGPLSGPDWDLTGLFRRWLSQRARVWQPDEVRAFGVLLHRRLFAGPNVWPWIEKQTDGAALVRLTLSFPAEPPYSQLAALPWEYLYVPGEPTRKGEFLAEREGFSLARYIPLRAGVPQLSPVERPRLLAVVSSPETLGEVVAEPVLAALRDAAGLAGFEHREVRLTSADEMRDAIAGWQPHLVHFLGHGEFDQATGAGLLAFPAAGGRAAWVGDAAVAKLFVSREHAPRVVVLHACEGGVTDYDAQFAGVASTLTRAGAQCVVAMQYPVTNRAAIAFSTAFYRELAAHGTVDLAAQQARRELAGPELGDPRLVGIPVIYLHNDTSLFEPPEPVAEADAGIGAERATGRYEFEVQIGAGKITGVYSRPGVVEETIGPVDLYDDVPQLKDEAALRLETVELFDQWLNHWDMLEGLLQDRSRRDLVLANSAFELLGSHLWHLVLDNAVGRALEAALREPRGGRPLRVLICFDGADRKLTGLPWEFLYLPKTRSRAGLFWAARTELVLSRFVHADRELSVQSADRSPLRVLFVYAFPSTDDFAGEKGRLNAMIKELRVLNGLTVSDAAIWPGAGIGDRGSDLAFLDGLGGEEHGPPDIVHVVGVCMGDVGRPRILVTGDQRGEVIWQEPDRLVTYLRQFAPAVRDDGAVRGARLVVLHLCERKGGDPSENFERLAPTLIAEGIPAVLATQYPYPLDVGKSAQILLGFYRDLAAGKSVGEAVQGFRFNLQDDETSKSRWFGSPVLYLSSADGPLRQEQPPIVSTTTGTPAPVEPQFFRRKIKNTFLPVIERSDLPEADKQQLSDWVWETDWSAVNGDRAIRTQMKDYQHDNRRQTVYTKMIQKWSDAGGGSSG